MNRDPLSRRGLIGASAASLGLLGLGSAVPALAATRPKAPRNPLPLDLTRPADNVYAIIKMQGDVGGNITYSWGHGDIYGISEGEMARPLLRYQSCRVGRYVKQADGSYLFRYRGMIFYLDPDTGAFIDEMVNPYTGKTVKIRHYTTSLGEYVYTELGIKPSPRFQGRAGKPYGQPYVLPWVRAGDRIWTTLDERVEYRRPSDNEWRRDNAILRYEARWADLVDPELTSAPVASSFQTFIAWFTFLDMNGHPGGIMQGGAGWKFNTLDELPNDFIAGAEARFPGILTNPVATS